MLLNRRRKESRGAFALARESNAESRPTAAIARPELMPQVNGTISTLRIIKVLWTCAIVQQDHLYALRFGAEFELI